MSIISARSTKDTDIRVRQGFAALSLFCAGVRQSDISAHRRRRAGRHAEGARRDGKPDLPRLIADFQGISHTTPSHVGFHATLSAEYACSIPNNGSGRLDGGVLQGARKLDQGATARMAANQNQPQSAGQQVK